MVSDNAYWLAHWEQQSIAFHREAVNPHLMTYIGRLNLALGDYILVPLCGKSKDMLWLASQGFRVLGVELSPIACEAFFIENKLDYHLEVKGEFTHYIGRDIEIVCGDFFHFTPMVDIHAVYDHAALAALPPAIQKNYLDHVFKIISPRAKILLTACEFNAEMKGPPFNVDIKHWLPTHSIKLLDRIVLNEAPQHFINKGFQSGAICYYLLDKESVTL